ncbi:hypothetical protein HPP92_014006 [Vanilla planifolia]|uniref:Uncharacterized protein n=1 Tax=Vanilla planifolia TaxID=51239 RepID=A0A835QVU9_VANPL|nr:hypothetical protein HPP92_014006 [Vanilla planifolia]
MMWKNTAVLAANDFHRDYEHVPLSLLPFSDPSLSALSFARLVITDLSASVPWWRVCTVARVEHSVHIYDKLPHNCFI